MSSLRQRILVTFLLALCLGALGTEAAPVEISYMSWYTLASASGQAEQAVIDRFNELNPDIKVVKIGGDPRQQLSVMIAAGTPPDTSVVNGPQQNDLLTQIALELTPYLKGSSFNSSDYLPGLMQSVMVDGRLYGIPWGFGFRNLFINKGMFEQAGLPFPQRGWTIDEFHAAARVLTTAQGEELGTFGYGVTNPHLYPEHPLYLAHGANIIDPATGLTDIHQSPYVNAVQFVSNLFNVDRIAGYKWPGFSNLRAAFVGRRFGMIDEWQSAIPNLIDSADQLDWAMVYWPTGDGPLLNVGHGHCVAVIKGSPHPDEAARFALFWSSWEAEQILASYGVYPQTIRGLRTMALGLQLPQGMDIVQVMGPILDSPQVYVPPYLAPGYIKARTELLIPALTSIIQNNVPTRQVLEELRGQVDEVLLQR